MSGRLSPDTQRPASEGPGNSRRNQLPQSFEDELRQLMSVKIVRDAQGLESAEFAIVFVSRRKEVVHAALALIKGSADDAILWFAYPKGTQKTSG